MEVLKKASPPRCLHYHPSCELAVRTGYYPNLTPAQLAAAAEVRTRLESENLSLNLGESETFLALLRFLRARKFDVVETTAMLRNHLKWEQEMHIRKWKDSTLQDVLDCDVERLLSHYPVWLQGFDKQFRPVSYRQLGNFQVEKVLKFTTAESLIKFHIWQSELAIRLLDLQSQRLGYHIEGFTVVIDAAGFSILNATREAINFCKALAATDSDHYPERLGVLLVINAPAVLSIAWRIVQTFLDDVTKSKIRIFSTDKSDWQPVLFDIVDKSQVPKQYGGLAPDLIPLDAMRKFTGLTVEQLVKVEEPTDTIETRTDTPRSKKSIFEVVEDGNVIFVDDQSAASNGSGSMSTNPVTDVSFSPNVDTRGGGEKSSDFILGRPPVDSLAQEATEALHISPDEVRESIDRNGMLDTMVDLAVTTMERTQSQLDVVAAEEECRRCKFEEDDLFVEFDDPVFHSKYILPTSPSNAADDNYKSHDNPSVVGVGKTAKCVPGCVIC